MSVAHATSIQAADVEGQSEAVGAPSGAKAPADGSASPSTTNALTRPAAAQPNKNEGKASGDVVVTARRPDVQRFVDRRSYAIDRDVNYAAGSIADVLKGVPLIDVDPNGSISVRGDNRITVLVDGQPSPLFEGPGRATAIQQIPASRYERVEVMTNPSAAYSPEGSAIINLITKKVRQPENSATVGVNADTAGRASLNVSNTYANGPISILGSVGLKRDVTKQKELASGDTTDPVSNETSHTTSTSELRRFNNSLSASETLDFQPESHTHLSSELNLNASHSYGSVLQAYQNSISLGPLDADYTATQDSTSSLINISLTGAYRKQFPQYHGQLLIRFTTAYYNSDLSNSALFHYNNDTPELYQRLEYTSPHDTLVAKVEYKGAIPNHGDFVLGYDGRVDISQFQHQNIIGNSLADATFDATTSNTFHLIQSINALYGTYQRNIAAFDIMGGLRGEVTNISANQVTSDSEDQYDYFHLFPSLHVNYKLDESNNINFSYSKRILRPGPESLNSFKIYYNPLSYSQGNDRLRPSIVDSYELSYDKNLKSFQISSDLYYKREHDTFFRVQDETGGGIFISTFENTGEATAWGVSVTGSGKFGSDLQIFVDANAYRKTLLDMTKTPYVYDTHSYITGHLKFNWNVDKNDFVQARWTINSRFALPQGNQAATQYVDIGYRRSITDRLSFAVTGNDIFNTFRTDKRTQSADFFESDLTFYHMRAIQLSLSYKFGGRISGGKSTDFDYSTGN